MESSLPDKSTAGIIHDPYQQNNLEDSDRDDFEDIHEEDDDEPDPVYMAHILRQMGASWATSVQYATHRLIISKDNNALGHNYEFPGIAQFLIPASAIFRDFLAIDHEDIGRYAHLLGEQSDRLSCLQYRSIRATQSGDPASHPLPVWRNPHHPGVFHEPQKVPSIGSSSDEAPLLLPVLELTIPYPEHFQPLLHAMYDLEIDPWAATFTPATIGPITANVARLECSTNITLRCLKYYQQIRSSQVSDTMHSTGAYGEREDLERLYQLATMNGLLS
ncbi:hypothetical protein BG000_006976 [Podila horticola]|nr:hypothetical protein BG000_006976 [Podila horticola]